MHQHTQFQIPVECIIRKVGAGHQCHTINDRQFCVQLPRLTRLIAFTLARGPVEYLGGCNQIARKRLQCIKGELPFGRFGEFEYRRSRTLAAV